MKKDFERLKAEINFWGFTITGLLLLHEGHLILGDGAIVMSILLALYIYYEDL